MCHDEESNLKLFTGDLFLSLNKALGLYRENKISSHEEYIM